ncbi:MAG: acyltransferase family protein [Nitrospirae bacterium]|nr:acyltransferase family protein [Nitrospirota bacterium]
MSASERYYHLDWIRVLGIIVVFTYHAGRIFDPLFWYNTFEVRNNQTSQLFTYFCFGVTFWLMPIFFLLAGASTSFSFSRKTSYQFIADRTKRLLVPFLFFLIILIPPQLYMESIQAGKYQGTFFSFFPTAFSHVGIDLSNPHVITFPHKHLWFLWYLFFISVITVPVFKWLNSQMGKALILRLAQMVERPAAIFLFVIPLAAIRVVLAPIFPAYQNYDDFFYWTLLVIYGFILYSDKRFEAAIVKQSNNALAIGVLCYVGFACAAGSFVDYFEHPRYTLRSALFEIGWCLNAWAWLIFFIGTAKKYLNHPNRFLSYSNEAVLPFYITHKTIILIIAFNIATLPINLYVKFLLLMVSAFTATMILYEFVIRRIDIVRILSGMPAKKKPG